MTASSNTVISLVYAISRNGVIGKDGGLPWKVSADLKNFKAVTMGKPLIMGRRTWDSLPRKPLPGRLNIVVTRQQGFKAEGAVVAADVAHALKLASDGQPQEICVIGGAEVFRQTLPMATRVYLTLIEADVEGDVFFPTLPQSEWREIRSEHHNAAPGDTAGFTFSVLERKA
jgi:dihydrofolate reductase